MYVVTIYLSGHLIHVISSQHSQSNIKREVGKFTKFLMFQALETAINIVKNMNYFMHNVSITILFQFVLYDITITILFEVAMVCLLHYLGNSYRRYIDSKEI